MAADSRAEDRMNLAALQQCDPYVKSIVQTASQVALYIFNAEGNEWVSWAVWGDAGYALAARGSHHNESMAD